MIVGLVQARCEPAPEWPAALSSWAARLAGGNVHLAHTGARGESHFTDGSLTVVAVSHPAAGETKTAAERVADAYRRDGLERLRPAAEPVAFVLHDERARVSLATSSLLSPWPLAYWTNGETTVVGSRILPLLKVAGAPRAIDDLYLAHLVFGMGAMPPGSTAIRGIRRLRPGEAIVVEEGALRVLPLDRLHPREIPGSTAGRIDAFWEELEGAAARTVRARDRPCISLSGGLDSAAVAVAMLRGQGDLSALSMVAPAIDEAAEELAVRALESAWPGLRVTRLDASNATEFPDLSAGELRDDPLLAPLSFLPARQRLWSAARDGGFRTLVEGEGGDELLSILPSPFDALRHGQWPALVRHLWARNDRRATVTRALLLPMAPTLAQRAWARRQPVDAHLPAFAVWGAAELPVVREATEQFFIAVAKRHDPDRADAWLSSPVTVGMAASRVHLAAAYGLDVAWPLLDRGVVELVLGLPASDTLSRESDKRFLREALKGRIPEEVRTLPKELRLHDALLPRVLGSSGARRALLDERVRARLGGLVRFERLEAMLDGLASGREVGPRALWAVECVVSFAEWYARASREYGVA